MSTKVDTIFYNLKKSNHFRICFGLFDLKTYLRPLSFWTPPLPNRDAYTPMKPLDQPLLLCTPLTPPPPPGSVPVIHVGQDPVVRVQVTWVLSVTVPGATRSVAMVTGRP